MSFSLFPVDLSSFSFAAATSDNSAPYLNVLPESECTTAALSGSCFWIASKKAERCIGANLDPVMVEKADDVQWTWARDLIVILLETLLVERLSILSSG